MKSNRITIPICSWMEPRQCQDKSTHYHHAYGMVCGYHARLIEQHHNHDPRERCKKLRGPLIKQLLGETQCGYREVPAQNYPSAVHGGRDNLPKIGGEK